MSCEICGRGSCTRSFHSIEAQEEFDERQSMSDDVGTLREELQSARAELAALRAERDKLLGCRDELREIAEAINDPRIHNTMTIAEWCREASWMKGERHELQRYGIEWTGPSTPICVKKADGYWTPWHVAQTELAALRDKALRFDLDHAGIERREAEAVELVELRAELAALRAELECGHPASLMVHSAETGEPLYCELCDIRSQRNDAVKMETHYRERAEKAEAERDALRAALDWYGEKAKEMGKAALHSDSKRMLSLMHELAVDYGKRAALGER